MAKNRFVVGPNLEKSISQFQTEAHGKNLLIERVVDPKVGTIVADELRFNQIMNNLLSNAVKFTPEGGKITVSARILDADGDRTGLPDGVPAPSLLVGVQDSGIGIAEKDMARIWNKFEQVESSYARRFQGTGLGLPLTKRLVELHGGRIWVRSGGNGEGSCFSFALPFGGGDA